MYKARVVCRGDGASRVLGVAETQEDRQWGRSGAGFRVQGRVTEEGAQMQRQARRAGGKAGKQRGGQGVEREARSQREKEGWGHGIEARRGRGLCSGIWTEGGAGCTDQSKGSRDSPGLAGSDCRSPETGPRTTEWISGLRGQGQGQGWAAAGGAPGARERLEHRKQGQSTEMGWC